MAGSGFESGQARVAAKEMNNRKRPGQGGKVPIKKGARAGFASNRMSGKKPAPRP